MFSLLLITQTTRLKQFLYEAFLINNITQKAAIITSYLDKFPLDMVLLLVFPVGSSNLVNKELDFGQQRFHCRNNQLHSHQMALLKHTENSIYQEDTVLAELNQLDSMYLDNINNI